MERLIRIITCNIDILCLDSHLSILMILFYINAILFIVQIKIPGHGEVDILGFLHIYAKTFLVWGTRR